MATIISAIAGIFAIGMIILISWFIGYSVGKNKMRKEFEGNEVEFDVEEDENLSTVVNDYKLPNHRYNDDDDDGSFRV